jgi:PAS domain S-box-containing protein
MNAPKDAAQADAARPAFLPAIAVGALLSLPAALSVAGLLDFPTFHALTQTACMAAGMTTFLVLWNARSFLKQNYFLVLGPAFLAAAVFVWLHTLHAAELVHLPLPWELLRTLPTAGNLGLAATLCAGAWLAPRPRRNPVAVLAVVTGGNLALWLLFASDTGPLPAIATPPLATVPHVAALALFATAALPLFRERTGLGPEATRPLLAALTCLAVAEAAFASGLRGAWPDLAGHTAKLLGYALFCRAAVIAGVVEPQRLLRREVDRREGELTARMVRLGAQTRATYELTRLKSLEGGDFDSFARTLLGRAQAVLHLEQAGVWLLSPEGNRLTLAIGAGDAGADAATTLDVYCADDYREALAHERLLAVGDTASWPLAGPVFAAALAARGVASCIDVPLRFSGRLAGVLKLEHVGTPRAFADDELAFAGTLADLLVLGRESTERRLAARNLAESEQRLRAFVDAMPDPACLKGADGRWLVANRAMLETLRLPATGWEGRTSKELDALCAGDKTALEAMAATDNRTWAAREAAVFGLTLTGADGNDRHFDIIKAPLFHTDGRPRGMAILARDVTAYRDALSRLRESNAELEAIYNETSDGLVIADIGNQSVVRVNAAACRMFGDEPRALTALSPWDLHPPEERERFVRLFGEIAAGRLRLLEGIPCRRADGTTFFADISAQPIAYGGRAAILGFYRDITERRAVDATLRASEERFRRVFNSTYDAIFLHDAQGAILDLNDKALELYGMRREEINDIAIARDLSAPETSPGLLHEYWSAVLAGQERFFEWKARRPHDGSVFHVEVYLRRILLGERPVILANVRDVTERKRVQAALAARQEEISALNRDLAQRVREATEKNRQKDILLLNRTRLAAMGEMIGNIAHQWRQPLNALSIVLANMRFEFEAACGEEGEALAAAHRQAGDILRKMSATIDDFRDFFRPDKERKAFHVVAAINDALLLIEANLAQHGIALRVTARRNPRVMGFPGEFSQVALNLVGNARDAILASGVRAGVIAIRVMERHGQAVVHVRDNGGGIPEADLPRVFDPYFTTKNDNGGTGLGLYMSKTIIEDHMRGSLTVANAPGGARFVMRMPLANAAEAPLPAARATPPRR